MENYDVNIETLGIHGSPEWGHFLNVGQGKLQKAQIEQFRNTISNCHSFVIFTSKYKF